MMVLVQGISMSAQCPVRQDMSTEVVPKIRKESLDLLYIRTGTEESVSFSMEVTSPTTYNINAN
jgi:hypothetical protein